MIAPFAKLGRFASVGIVSTAGYFAFGWAFARLAGFPPLGASAAAYACAALISYLGHRSFTFRSDRAHAAAAPRFAALTALGFAVAGALAAIGERLGLPVEVALAATCVAIPAINFVAMDRGVFQPLDRTGRHGV